MQRPLIVGASVSGDFLSESPGRKLASAYTVPQEIRVIAQNGAPGREVVKRLQTDLVKDRSIAIGLDLFFWDSTLPSPQPSLEALRKFDEMMTAFQIPYVLGDIPELLPGWQMSRNVIQDAIQALSQMNPLCHLLPLDAICKEVMSTGSVKYNGRSYGFWELVPDGLHIGEIAGHYLADQIKNLLLSRQ